MTKTYKTLEKWKKHTHVLFTFTFADKKLL